MTGNLLKSPFKFSQHGQSGAWVSDIFPEVAGCVDDLCIINSMHGSNSRHGGALLELHTGSDTFVRPSMGSWITYGLGTESQDLPGYITVCPTLTHGGVNAYSSAFLPAVYAGTALGNAGISSDQAKIPFIVNADGTLVYMGGIDDKATTDVADIKTAKNYVRAALDNLAAGAPIANAVTRPYGCSVKYKTAS